MKSVLVFLVVVLCARHVQSTICSSALNDTVVCGGHGTCATGVCTCDIQYTSGNSATAAGALGSHAVFITYAVLAATTLTNTGATRLQGNSGVTSMNAISGTAPTYSGGTFAYHSHDTSANNSMADALASYTALRTHSYTHASPPTALSGTLPPGVYWMQSGATLATLLTLDFQGKASAVFEFRITGSLSTSSASQVVTVNGGANADCRVFWTVTTTATLGASSQFVGSLIANGAVSLGVNARVTGRLASLTAGATLNTNYVNSTVCSSIVNTCVGCPAGQQGTEVNVCGDCPIGKFKAVQSGSPCSDCYAHSNATSVGATSCTCFAGYDGTTAALTCTACRLGAYKVAVSNGACTNCSVLSDKFTTTETTASTAAADCGCKHGYFDKAGGTHCLKCDQGSYSDTVGQTVCTNCSTDGSASIGRGAVACTACPSGYTNNSANTLCSIDINECLLTPAVCGGVCTNSAGSYACSCLGEFSLDPADNKTCISLARIGGGQSTSYALLIAFIVAAGVAVCLGSLWMGKEERDRMGYASTTSL